MGKPLVYLLVHTFFCLPSFSQQAVIDSFLGQDSLAAIIFLTSRPLVNNKILLQWKSTSMQQGDFYIIERSVDQKGFEVIGAIKTKGTGASFEFLDERPSASTNYYRIRMPVSDKLALYSHTITAGIAGKIFCRFYPNPVDKLLIVRSEYTVHLKITDEYGKVRLSQRLQPGLQSVDVSCLERSSYIITLLQQESNQVISGKLLKN